MRKQVTTTNNKMTRTLVVAGATLTPVLLVAGCSPPELELVAIGRDSSGDVRALLRPCSNDDHIKRLDVMVDMEAEPSDPAILAGWSARPPASATGEQEISLLKPPTNWEGATDTATTLAPRMAYFVHFFVGPGDTIRYSGFTAFKRSDVERLAPGQWLVDGKPMTRVQFQSYTHEAC